MEICVSCVQNAPCCSTKTKISQSKRLCGRGPAASQRKAEDAQHNGALLSAAVSGPCVAPLGLEVCV